MSKEKANVKVSDLERRVRQLEQTLASIATVAIAYTGTGQVVGIAVQCSNSTELRALKTALNNVLMLVDRSLEEAIRREAVAEQAAGEVQKEQETQSEHDEQDERK